MEHVFAYISLPHCDRKILTKNHEHETKALNLEDVIAFFAIYLHAVHNLVRNIRDTVFVLEIDTLILDIVYH